METYNTWNDTRRWEGSTFEREGEMERGCYVMIISQLNRLRDRLISPTRSYILWDIILYTPIRKSLSLVGFYVVLTARRTLASLVNLHTALQSSKLYRNLLTSVYYYNIYGHRGRLGKAAFSRLMWFCVSLFSHVIWRLWGVWGQGWVWSVSGEARTTTCTCNWNPC